MFIYSMRAGTVRFVGVVAVALAALVMLIAFVPQLQPAAAVSVESASEISSEKIKTNDDRIRFLGTFGWQVEGEPVEATTVRIPDTFDKVFSAYNDLQKGQGLDLSALAGKTVERYTYKVTNYEGYEGTVLVNLFVYHDRIIGADVSSADAAGFIHGLKK